MNILLTGADGFVGHKIYEDRDDVIKAPSLRNAAYEEVVRVVEESGADVIINTAAISDTGACANDPEASYIANVQLPVFLAKAAKGRKLICFSSDQVYSGCEGEGPYTEEDVKTGNVYAEHKFEMENRVLDIAPDSVMLRAEWMYDVYHKKSNYFMNMINAVGEVSFSPAQFRGVTYVREVAENVEKVIALPGGAYNFGSETCDSMYEITKQFVKTLGRDIKVNDAPSRHNLWMDCSKAKKFGVTFSSVINGLIRCAKDNGFIV